MNDLSLKGFLFLLVILFGCAATSSQTAKAPPTEPITEDIPGHWVSNDTDWKNPEQQPASLTVKSPESTDEVRYENCGDDRDIAEVGPATSEVGVAVPMKQQNVGQKQAYLFSRHYCKTDKTENP